MAGTQRTLQGVASHDSLKSLRPIFAKWNGLIDRYAEVVPEDVPYGMGRERSTLGFLQTAAILHGWQGLQEFSQTKSKQEPDQTGRNDLWLYQPRKHSYYIEAKISYSNLEDEKRRQWAEDCLERAREDVKCVRAYSNEDPVYLALALLTFRGEAGTQREIREAVADVRTWIDAERPRLAAWIFPESKRGASGLVGVAALVESVQVDHQRIPSWSELGRAHSVR